MIADPQPPAAAYLEISYGMSEVWMNRPPVEAGERFTIVGPDGYVTYWEVEPAWADDLLEAAQLGSCVVLKREPLPAPA